MNDRRLKWNDRYARSIEPPPDEASAPLPDLVRRIRPGTALDLACGLGRQTLYLAARGWRVVAVDWASNALARIAATAHISGYEDRIELIEADLEADPRGFDIRPAAFDLILDFFFLDRSLFPVIREGVMPGGRFCAAIHLADPCATNHQNPAFLLERGELGDLVAGWGWSVEHLREADSSNDTRAVVEIVARKPGESF